MNRVGALAARSRHDAANTAFTERDSAPGQRSRRDFLRLRSHVYARPARRRANIRSMVASVAASLARTNSTLFWLAMP